MCLLCQMSWRGEMFKDCHTDLEKNKYKTEKLLQKENDQWLKENDFEFYQVQRTGAFCDIFELICKRVEIPETKERFLHFIDHRYLFDTTRGYRFENITPDYSCMIRNGLCNLKYTDCEVINKFCEDYNRTIESLIFLIRRICAHEKLSDNGYAKKRVAYFENMIAKPAESFEEGLQRILFFHQMFWQIGQRLMGLGHLDNILIDLYEKDLKDGKLSREDAELLIGDFFEALHRYCWLKSNMLLGDTGQIIILGNRGKNGEYVYNELTYLFIEVTAKKQLPDPKILLRVDNNTPRKLVEAAMRCIQTGVGAPILSNDDEVIPRLAAFGVSEEDARQYGVAACWEPLIPGKSISPNNMKSITYPRAMQAVWERKDIETLDTLEKWMEAFYEEVQKEINGIIDIISEARFQYNPYLSIFMHDCFDRKQDVSCGGAVYNSYGLTTVGLSNTVNAVLSLKELVYDTQEYSLQEVREILKKNFEGYASLRMRLKETSNKYGMDEPEIIALSNDILVKTSKMVQNFRNYMGGRLKIGVSSPSYIDAAKDVMASFDGRKCGEAFGVHISSETNNGYTEIINFASKLNYDENRFNGNVVDFMVAPSFIEHNFDKMVDLVLAGIKIGFFQLQMNVIGSGVLMEAKKKPEKFPELVVRVWGFSAYFRDLPEEYQDVLISRARQNERRT